MIHSENRLAPRMVLIITNHEYRRKLEQTFQNFRIPIYYQCQGHGTAPSEMLDIFGLSGSGRLLTIGLLPKFLVRDLLDALQQRSPLQRKLPPLPSRRSNPPRLLLRHLRQTVRICRLKDAMPL